MKLPIDNVLSILLVLSAFGCNAVPEARKLHEITFQSNLVAVLSEGAREPYSIGSYSLRVYEVLDSGFPYDNYITGVISLRDGTIERLAISDIDGDNQHEIIVIARVVGSGGYLFAHAYKYSDRTLRLIASVSGLRPLEDPIKSMVAKYHEITVNK